VPVKANSGVRARVPAAGKVLEGDDKPTLLREDQHYLLYITIYVDSAMMSAERKSHLGMPEVHQVLTCFSRQRLTASMPSTIKQLIKILTAFD